jgi:hypothetical protein
MARNSTRADVSPNTSRHYDGGAAGRPSLSTSTAFTGSSRRTVRIAGPVLGVLAG